MLFPGGADVLGTRSVRCTVVHLQQGHAGLHNANGGDATEVAPGRREWQTSLR